MDLGSGAGSEQRESAAVSTEDVITRKWEVTYGGTQR